MYEGRLNIPCARPEDELRETVGRANCLFYVGLVGVRDLEEEETDVEVMSNDEDVLMSSQVEIRCVPVC